MRSAPEPFWQNVATPWHYVTIHDGEDYRTSDAPAEGDAMTALTRFTATLRDPKASMDDKRLALRFIVHLIGDLHQPLHAGARNDRGGNDVKVSWFGRPTNLDSVWDSGLIDQRALSYTEYTAWLVRSITPGQIIAWSEAKPADWIHEDLALGKTIYPVDPDLSWTYAYQHKEEVDERLQQADVRIAAYLNAIFDGPGADPQLTKRK